MHKNILIINSSNKKNSVLIELLDELWNRGYYFYLLSSSKGFIADFEKDKRLAKKVFLGPRIKNNFSFFLFLLMWPALFLFYFFYLIYLKSGKKAVFKKGINTIICLNWNEKMIFSLIAFLLKIKIVWFEYPSIDYKTKPLFLMRVYKFFSKHVKIITFIEFSKRQLLNFGFCKDNIKIIPIGVRPGKCEYQDNIFSTLAKADNADFSRKYFTIGTVVDLVLPNQVENLFQAARNCLSVIPNLQIIIVGDGEDRKKLNWIAKKMEIENLVWFVGKQKNIKKWIDNFDLFIATSEKSKLIDLQTVLQIMAAGIPVIGFLNKGFEDMIIEDRTGFLVDSNNSEVLATEIIRLYKDGSLRRRLSREDIKLVEERYIFDKQVEKMEDVL